MTDGLRRERVSITKVAALEDAMQDMHALLSGITAATKVFDDTPLSSPEYLDRKHDVKQKVEEAKAFLEQHANPTAMRCLAPVVNVLESAQALVQADNAITLGRDGAEARWDQCLTDLKTTLKRIKFDE